MVVTALISLKGYSLFHFVLWGHHQAGGFLVSGKSPVVVEDRELDENIHSNGDYVDTASLLEKVFYALSC